MLPKRQRTAALQDLAERVARALPYFDAVELSGCSRRHDKRRSCGGDVGVGAVHCRRRLKSAGRPKQHHVRAGFLGIQSDNWICAGDEMVLNLGSTEGVVV